MRNVHEGTVLNVVFSLRKRGHGTGKVSIFSFALGQPGCPVSREKWIPQSRLKQNRLESC